jgi:endoglucanase
MMRERRALLLMVGSLFGAMALITLVLWAVLGGGGHDGASGAAGASARATATPTATAAVTGDPATCTAEYTVTGSWPDGFGAQVVVTTGPGAAAGWELTWTFPADARVTELWNATLAADGTGGELVRVTAPGWDPDLAAGEQITIGFNGARGADVPQASGIALDGVPCAGPDGDLAVAEIEGETARGRTDGVFYVDPTGQAADAAATATGEDRTAAERIAGTAQALWVVDADPATARAQAADYTARAASAARTGVLVVYGIPGRDCGAYSSGGASAADTYLAWVTQIADGLVGSPWVVLEPDALAQLGDCDGQGDRAGMLREAARILDEAGAQVYLDAGHAAWLSADEAARRLQEVGTDHLAGFALNVSNDRSTAESRTYGDQISTATGGLHYVIDTSRNGNGGTGEWCNAPGRALGDVPTLVRDGTALDALLWVKRPGESDGTCNGGPAAGAWWPEAARTLVANAA